LASLSHPFLISRDPDLREVLPGVGQVTVHILADDGLLVGAGNVVPLDTVSVVVVQNCHAGLGVSVQLSLLPVVWLLNPEAPGVGPVVEGAGGVGGRHGYLGGGPEPAVDVLREEVRSVTPIKVTETAGGPEVRDIGIHESLDPVIFLLSVK